MSPYAEQYADLYDLLYTDKPYESEVEFLDRLFHDFAMEKGARILELACGTGEHAIRLAKRGYTVTATDYSSAMVERARRKAEYKRATLILEQRDMRELTAPVTPFDAAVCLFDSIGYAQTDSAVEAVFDGVQKNLRAGGLFVVEFWHAPAMVNGFDPVRVRRIKNGRDTVLRISETELEQSRALAHVTYNVYRLRDNQTYHHVEERHTARYFTVAEMEALARRHYFDPLATFDGFHSDRSVSEATWHVVALYQKRNDTNQN